MKPYGIAIFVVGLARAMVIHTILVIPIFSYDGSLCSSVHSCLQRITVRIRFDFFGFFFRVLHAKKSEENHNHNPL